MKKFLALMLALLMVFSMVACAKEEVKEDDAEIEEVETEVKVEEEVEEVEVEEEEEEAPELDAEAMIQYIADAMFREVDASLIFDLFHEDVIALLQLYSGEEYDAMIESLNEELEATIETLNDVEWDYEVVILEETALNDDEIAELQAMYDEAMMDIIVEEGVSVEAQIVLSSGDQEETQDVSVVFTLVDGEWYLDPAAMGDVI